MKTIKFNKIFYDKILSGEKTLTTRKKGRFNLRRGDIVEALFTDGSILNLFIKDVHDDICIDFDRQEVSKDEIIRTTIAGEEFYSREGFNSKKDFFEFISRFNYKSGEFITYEFRVCKKSDMMKLPCSVCGTGIKAGYYAYNGMNGVVCSSYCMDKISFKVTDEYIENYGFEEVK